MARQKVISNSSPLINLAKVGQLVLVKKLYGKIVIPDAVYDEIIGKGKNKEGSGELIKLVEEKVITVSSVKDKNLVKILQKDIDAGESEVIALSFEINADLILLDESDARSMAEFYDINKTGFIGLLIKAQYEGLINNALEIIDLAIAKGFWINEGLYKKIKQML